MNLEKTVATKLQIQEIIEFPINAGRYGTWRYIHRYTEELRDFYRARHGRKNFRIKVERRYADAHQKIARIVVLAP